MSIAGPLAVMRPDSARGALALEHDPQKWKPLLRIMLKSLNLREFFSTR
jgi:hypothetical protein